MFRRGGGAHLRGARERAQVAELARATRRYSDAAYSAAVDGAKELMVERQRVEAAFVAAKACAPHPDFPVADVAEALAALEEAVLHAGEVMPAAADLAKCLANVRGGVGKLAEMGLAAVAAVTYNERQKIKLWGLVRCSRRQQRLCTIVICSETDMLFRLRAPRVTGGLIVRSGAQLSELAGGTRRFIAVVYTSLRERAAALLLR